MRAYKFGFNGKENDFEVKGWGNQYDYGERIYDPRIGRFLSIDPLKDFYPYYTPYQFAGNSPIANIDLDGAEPKPQITGKEQEGQKEVTTQETQNAKGDYTGTLTKTWYWHAGGLLTTGGQTTQAGYYESEEYVNVLLGTRAARVLGNDLNLYSSTALNDDAHKAIVSSRSELEKFVGSGVNDAAASHMLAAAKIQADKANYRVTGHVEPSNFNVEDILGVGVILKQGLKYLGTVAAKNIAIKEGQQLLLQAPANIQRHHILPQEFKGWFKSRGITNIDDYTIEISSQTHLKGVHGRGLGNLPGRWNQKWADFIRTNPNVSPSEIFNQAEGMRKLYGLEHLPYVPYKK